MRVTLSMGTLWCEGKYSEEREGRRMRGGKWGGGNFVCAKNSIPWSSKIQKIR